MSLTDFNATSIRDGIQGGVWRAVWQGLTGQAAAKPFDVFQGAASKEVHFTGPFILMALIAGAAPDLLVFNTLWTVLSVGLQAALGISVALLLHRRGVQFRGWWRAIFILPWAIPEFVGALIWLRIFEPDYGWLAVNPNIPKDALILPALAQSLNQELLVLLIAATWYGFPFLFLAATAALKLAPDEVYDAAAIDGASVLRLFRYVTWPLLLPLVTPALIIRAIFAFNQFYLFYTLRTRLGTYATISYNFFSGRNGQFAVSAAINLFTVLVLIVLISRFDRWSKAAEGVTYV
jgi:arabinogalactan oligomer/maltooligosaccharide transport system permease protein